MARKRVKYLIAAAVLVAVLTALGFSGCKGNDDDTAAAADRTPRPCGELRIDSLYPTPAVDVVEGAVPCAVARRVMTKFYAQPASESGLVHVGPWTCTGPEGDAECQRGPTRAVGAHFAGDPRFVAGGAIPGMRVARIMADLDAGVSFLLEGRDLTVRLLVSGPRRTFRRVSGERIRATCGRGFVDGPGTVPQQTRTRLWPATRTRLNFHFVEDISPVATWCRLENPLAGHVAFVKFADRQRQVVVSATRWARAFSRSAEAGCELQTQPACERIACERPGGVAIDNCMRPSGAYRYSFRDATVERVALSGERAAVGFSNGEEIGLVADASGLAHPGLWWLISDVGGGAGRALFK